MKTFYACVFIIGCLFFLVGSTLSENPEEKLIALYTDYRLDIEHVSNNIKDVKTICEKVYQNGRMRWIEARELSGKKLLNYTIGFSNHGWLISRVCLLECRYRDSFHHLPGIFYLAPGKAAEEFFLLKKASQSRYTRKNEMCVTVEEYINLKANTTSVEERFVSQSRKNVSWNTRTTSLGQASGSQKPITDSRCAQAALVEQPSGSRDKNVTSRNIETTSVEEPSRSRDQIINTRSSQSASPVQWPSRPRHTNVSSWSTQTTSAEQMSKSPEEISNFRHIRKTLPVEQPCESQDKNIITWSDETASIEQLHESQDQITSFRCTRAPFPAESSSESQDKNINSWSAQTASVEQMSRSQDKIIASRNVGSQNQNTDFRRDQKALVERPSRVQDENIISTSIQTESVERMPGSRDKQIVSSYQTASTEEISVPRGRNKVSRSTQTDESDIRNVVSDLENLNVQEESHSWPGSLLTSPDFLNVRRRQHSWHGDASTSTDFTSTPISSSIDSPFIFSPSTPTRTLTNSPNATRSYLRTFPRNDSTRRSHHQRSDSEHSYISLKSVNSNLSSSDVDTSSQNSSQHSDTDNDRSPNRVPNTP